MTSVEEAVRSVLEEAGEPLHWTVVQDRALRAGLIDPFGGRDVRKAVHGALRDLVAQGAARRVSAGVYELASTGP